MAVDIIARGMITNYTAGTNINFTENDDGTVEISASGDVSSEDTVARDMINNHTTNKENPHKVTAEQIGLDNVDNTSDIDKPVSTATQQALDKKAEKTHTHNKSDITDFPNSLPANGGNADTVNNHTVNSDVPTNAVFTDTWRGIQDNLTSDSAVDSLSANQGKILNEKVEQNKTDISTCKTNIQALCDVINGKTHTFVIDDTSAYSKPVPIGARLAGVKKLGGMTIKQNDSLISAPVTALHSTIDGRTVERTQIPDAVLALEGYGDGIDNNVYNYVDFGDKITFNKPVGTVDLGALNWNKYTVQGSDHTFKAPLTDLSSDINNNNGICIKYDVGRNVGITDGSNKGIWLRNNTKEIYLSDSTYTDVEAFKAAMSGVTLYYGLEAPVNTDISDMFPTDVNILDVIPGGQLTFENENKIAVPSNVEYIVSLAEVIS